MTPHDRTIVAARACVSERTVYRYLRTELPLRPSLQARIEGALRELGFAAFVRPATTQAPAA